MSPTHDLRYFLHQRARWLRQGHWNQLFSLYFIWVWYGILVSVNTRAPEVATFVGRNFGRNGTVRYWSTATGGGGGVGRRPPVGVATLSPQQGRQKPKPKPKPRARPMIVWSVWFLVGVVAALQGDPPFLVFKEYPYVKTAQSVSESLKKKTQ